MVLAPGDFKAIAAEIASKIITELRKPVEKSFIENEPVGVCEATYNDKDTLIGSFKDHERHTRKGIENERTQD